MIATKDVSALYNGRRYSFREGQEAKAPKPLLEALRKQGAVAARKRKDGDD